MAGGTAEGGWSRGGGWERVRGNREQAEGASFYKRMTNDNSAGNKTKHPSCCQANEASTFQDVGTRQGLAFRGGIGSRSPSAPRQQPNSSSTGCLLKRNPGVGERKESQPEPAVLLTVPFLRQLWSPVAPNVPSMPGANEMVLAPLGLWGICPPLFYGALCRSLKY